MKIRARWIIAVSATLILAGAAAIAIVVTVPSGGGSAPEASSTQTPGPIPSVIPPTTAPDASTAEVESASEALIASILAVTTTVSTADIDAVLDSLKPVASAKFLSGVEAERAELEDQGWTRSGEMKIDEVETLSHDTTVSPATATIRACIDSTDVVIRDSAGNALPGGAPRAWNIYVLEQIDGAWMVVGQTFADDPAC